MAEFTNKRTREKSTTPDTPRSKTHRKDKQENPEMNLEQKVDLLLGLFQRFDDADKKLDDVGTRLEKVETSLALIRSEVLSMQTAQIEITSSINDLQQANLATNFSVTGIPHVEGKAPIDQLNHVLLELGTKAELTDLKFLRLYKNRDEKSCRLYGRFWFEKQKAEIFGKFKNLLKQGKPMMTQSIYKLPLNSTLTGKQIRFHNELTKTNFELLKHARTLKDDPWKYVWESEGRIFVRKNDGERAINIKSVNQLRDITNVIKNQQQKQMETA